MTVFFEFTAEFLRKRDKLKFIRSMEVGARDVQGLPLFAQLAPKQSYASMAGKPTPSSHKSARQWNQVPVTLICQWKNLGVGGGGGEMGVKQMT